MTKENTKARYYRRKAAGVCVGCGQNKEDCAGTRCLTCKLYASKWSHNNKKWYPARSKARQAQHKLWFKQLKRGLQCVNCGETNPTCLDFHHKDPNTKLTAIARAISSGWGRERVLAEIEKCAILCANCHRKLQYKDCF